jgi:hypothetical protein
MCAHYHALRKPDGIEGGLEATRPVILFMGDFFSSSTTRAKANSIAKSQQFLFGELGATLCSSEFVVAENASLASLCDLLFIPGPHIQLLDPQLRFRVQDLLTILYGH